ncbi:unnamed protein product [Caenorhabditis auriculariae]|uniref:RING-type domain-containing protein n=1 Tax=Caenorhabditis auriculariae TaxID=2777116 RepID=A0A8S1GUL8_9PELO|nr:unnamed protein product [Caenorhabditis auriculariae]
MKRFSPEEDMGVLPQQSSVSGKILGCDLGFKLIGYIDLSTVQNLTIFTFHAGSPRSCASICKFGSKRQLFCEAFVYLQALLKGLFNKISNPRSKQVKQFEQLEDAENVIIDSLALRCPICYAVYLDVPLNLYCGHTFCQSCLEAIVRRENNGIRAREKNLACPLCREACCLKTAVKNYVVRDILDSLGALSATPEITDKIAETTAKIHNERLREKVKKLEGTINYLRQEIEEEKQRRGGNYIAIALFATCVSAILSAIFR